MFVELGYFTKVEYGVLRISHGKVIIITKGSTICELYILEGSNVIVHSSSESEEFYDKSRLWELRSKRGECHEVILENFNEFSKRFDCSVVMVHMCPFT